MSAFYGVFEGTSKALTKSLFNVSDELGSGSLIPGDALLTEDEQPILLESGNFLIVD